MKPGSIIIDLASESGGNCECSIVGEIVNINGVLVSGSKNITSEIAQDASALFAKNLLNFFKILIDNDTKFRIIESCKSGKFTKFGKYEVERIETTDGFKFFFNADTWLMLRCLHRQRTMAS